MSIIKLPQFTTSVFFTLGLSILTSNALAQESQQVDNKIERIEVTASFNDAAMKAFSQGQFDIAEIEFKKNATCARIAENNKRAAINGLVNNSLVNELSVAHAEIDTSQEGANSATRDTGTSSVTQGSGASFGKLITVEKIQKRTCTNRGFQLYMVGMSQIQLGQVKEAEENFETGVFLNKNLYDAHHRLALMKLLRGDKDGAQGELTSMKKILNRCRKCDVRDEIIARVDFIEKIFTGEVKLR